MSGSPQIAHPKLVVADTGPLNALANINCFEFLRELFSELAIPEMVYREATHYSTLPVARAVRQAAWINTIPVQDRVAVEVLRNELDDGESETIVLARELGASLILIDEKLARRKTAQMGLKTIGTLGILVMAKTSGLTPTVRSHLDSLKSSSFRMTRKLYDEILQRAGE